MCKKLGVLTLCAVVASLLAGPLAYAGDPTLIGWWKLNEGQGTTAIDSSGYGHNGTIRNPNGGMGTGNSVWVNDPERGMVISFNGTDGSSGCVTTTAIVPAMTLTNSFTWVFWAKQHTSQATNNDTILGNRYGGTATPLQFIKFTPTRFELYNDDGAYANGLNYNSIPANVWVHHVVVKDGTSLTYYRNGVSTVTNKMTKTVDANPFYMGADVYSGVVEAWQGYLSDVRLYARALTAAEVQKVMAGKGPGAELASEPVPAAKATDVPRDTTLSWKAGEFAGTHDVYLGPAFADVNTASRTDKKGVLAGQGQADATFDPPGVFAYGQSYYWRVDEVNKAPDNTIFKGDVWSFTVEPYGYPVKPAKATASSSQNNMGPEKTMDGSGLTGDLHGTDPTSMWMSAGVQPNWIQYEFDKVYKLHQLLVWNSNQLIEGLLGFGAKKVTIETSTDGTTWKALADVPEFARGPATPGYAANTTVNLGGVEAKFVKLTITANWGGMAPQTGLAEVRFFYVPVQARLPQPASAAKSVSVDAGLNWRPGREAASHKVFFGTDQAAVAGATAPAKTLTEHVYVPDALTLGTTYYWRVDEVNAAVTYPGDVWSFTTQAYKVVDDFESYTDKAGAEVFSIWIDGLADNYKSSGSTVGLNQAANGTFCETTIIHGDKRSMPLAYDNTKVPISEATRTFDSPQDWTTNGIKSLSLWFRGVAGNGGQLYVKINGTKIAYDGEAADLARATWHVWNIDLSKAGKVNSVRTLTIGIEGAGAKGTLYIDDIRLYATLPALITPADPGTTGLVAYYKLDGDAKDSAGTHHGTLSGAPQPFAAGKTGQALKVTDDNTYVLVPYSADLGMNTFTVAVWVNVTDLAALRGIVGTRIKGEYTFDLKASSTMIHGDIGSGTAWLNTAVDIAAANGGVLSTGVWHHLAYVVDDATDTAKMYLDGALAATATFTGTPLFMKSGQSLGIGTCYDGAVERMRGLIDDVRLYNRALSAAEAASLAGRPGPVFQAP